MVEGGVIIRCLVPCFSFFGCLHFHKQGGSLGAQTHCDITVCLVFLCISPGSFEFEDFCAPRLVSSMHHCAAELNFALTAEGPSAGLTLALF